MIKLPRIALATGLLLFSSLSLATPIQRTICVFDIAGNVGPTMSAMKAWRVQALKWGLKVKLLPYTDEGVATEDLKAGQCDAALITGIRARRFNAYTGTIDSVGSIPSMEQMEVLLKVLADPRSAPKMAANGYEVMGIAPIGAAYIFVNDRTINTLSKAAGKKVAVLDFDPTQAKLVAQVGATPVPSDITNFAGKFNNGVVDVIVAPLIAYDVLELYKGLQPNGGIIDYPLVELSMQLVARKDRFPEALMQKSREYFYHNLPKVLDTLKREAANVPDKWWVQIPQEDKNHYEVMLHDARVQLVKDGYYDQDMLTLQRKIRCKFAPSRAECTGR